MPSLTGASTGNPADLKPTEGQLCQECVSGVLHEGSPAGSTETLNGVETYVTLPKGDYSKEQAVLFLGDVFGQYTNAKLVADGFAANGFATYFPDCLNGDPIPLSAMNDASFDKDAWRAKHTAKQTRPPLDKVLEHLKKEGVTKIAAVGFCFGGRYTVDLALENLITVGATAHPSNLRIPEDFEELKAKSSVPLLVNACEIDQQWPRSSQDIADEMMIDYAPGWKQVYWPGCTHGFATRGDVNIPLVKQGKEGAFEETVKWFQKYLA